MNRTDDAERIRRLRAEIDEHNRRYYLLDAPTIDDAQFDRLINPFYGAPQSIYSDHFQWDDGATGRMSYKLEVPPLQPALTTTLLGRFGIDNALRMAQLPHTNVMLALMRDGFHPDSAEGTVELRGDVDIEPMPRTVAIDQQQPEDRDRSTPL